MQGGIPSSLFHYTNEAGLQGILESQSLRPSLLARNPKDARYGDGQYFSNSIPGDLRLPNLSRLFFKVPYQVRRLTHYLKINVEGLLVVKGREGVFVVPNHEPLDLTGRILRFGLVPQKEEP